MLEGLRHDDVHSLVLHLYQRSAKAKLYLQGVRAFGSVWFGFDPSFIYMVLVSGLQYASKSFFFACSVNKENEQYSRFFFFFLYFKQHKSMTHPGVHLTPDPEADQVKRKPWLPFLSHHCSPSEFISRP